MTLSLTVLNMGHIGYISMLVRDIIDAKLAH